MSHSVRKALPSRTVTGQEASLCTEAQIRMAEGMARNIRCPCLPQQAAHLRRCAGTQQPSAVHHRRMGGQRQRLLQPMLRQKDGGPQLPVDAAQRLEEVRGGDGV